MKVVLFCGGLGTRLREHSDTIPKPMVEIGNRPIIWHLMKYYAHYGHKEFILCLGYGGDMIKQFFLNYNEYLFNDVVLPDRGRSVGLSNEDIADWTITLVDTGVHANIGQRLQAVRQHLEGEAVFMANYSDGLADLFLPDYLDFFHERDKVASLLCVKASQSFHIVSMGDNGLITDIAPVRESTIWINGGFFVFRQQIYDYIREGEDLVCEPFQRLVTKEQLIGYKNRGFWACIDTLKEKKMFDELHASGHRPWAVWESAPAE